MLCPSLAHSPKSISLQRSLQKGRNGFLDDQTTDCLQVGHETILSITYSFLKALDASRATGETAPLVEMKLDSIAGQDDA